MYIMLNKYGTDVYQFWDTCMNSSYKTLFLACK
jgi:hypothetical protein